MEFNWGTTENLCVLYSMMAVMDAKQRALVTVRCLIVWLRIDVYA